MADAGVSGTRTERAAETEETPAIVCGSCRGETSLASLRPEVERPRCRHCGARFPGFFAEGPSKIDLRPIVRALIRALDLGDLRAASALVHPEVVWQVAPDGPGATGRDALIEHWSRSKVSRAVAELELQDDLVVGLVAERDVESAGGTERLVRWFVGFEGELIKSCWLWEIGRDETWGRRGR